MLDTTTTPTTQTVTETVKPGAAVETAKPDTTATTTTTDDDLLGTGTEDALVAAPANWPEDWRTKMAGGDEKIAKRLERMASPDAVLKSWLSAEQKISSGDLKKTLPENPTEQQLAEYRTSHGIPESPDKYTVAVDGVEFTPEDNAVIGKFTSALHGVHAKQEVVDAIMKTYIEQVQEAAEVRAEQDKAWKQTNEDKLRTELGTEFRSQVNLYKRVLEDPEVFPDGLGSVLGQARDAAGNRLLNDERVFRFLVDLGLERYGDGAITIGGSTKTAQTREAELVSLMRTNFAEYTRIGGSKELAEIRSKYRGQRDE